MSFPSLCLEINYVCTLDCFYCFRTVSDSKISASFIKDNQEWLEKLGVQRIVISGGEPLVHPEIFDIVRTLKEIKPERVISVTTGLYVGRQKINELLRHDDLIDEYLLNFETADDELLEIIKRRPCAAQLKENLKTIVDAAPNKARVNIVLSSREVFAGLADTLEYLRSVGVKRVKFFRDVRVADVYRITAQDFADLVQIANRFRSAIDLTGLSESYLLGDLKVPDSASSQAICITNLGELLEREERDIFSVLENYHRSVSKFTKHLAGASWIYYFFSSYITLGIVSFLRFGTALLLGSLASELVDVSILERNSITYVLPLYGFYIAVWTTSLWNRRNEALTKFANTLNQYFILLSECTPIVANKLLKQLTLLPATWDRYENVSYAIRVYETYGVFEKEDTRKALRASILDLAGAVDYAKAYEQYEGFRYLHQTLNKPTGIVSPDVWWKSIAFFLSQALIGDKRTFPYIVLFLTAVIVTILTQSFVVQCAILSVLWVVDYFCVENLSKLNIGLFSISRNLAVKLHYQMKIRDLWR